MSHSARRLTAAEQTAAHLREGIRGARWLGKLPGVLALAVECDVSPATMRAAIRILENDGWIRSGGAGRARTANPPVNAEKASAQRLMRVVVLPGMRLTDEDAVFQQLLMHLQRDLETAGHVCRFSPKSQEEMHYDLARIKKYVSQTQADAWVVVSGSREVITWFSQQKLPVIAIGGFCFGMDIAATGMSGMPAFEMAIRRLIELGHRSIVLLWPQARLRSGTSPQVLALKNALAAVGTEMSPYHIPEWPGTPEGLRLMLENTFRLTPPTAIIATYGNWMAGVLSFLAERGLRAPKDLSLLCLNEDAWFPWRLTEMACLRGDDTQIVRRIVRWVDAAARGRADRKYIGFPQKFVEGGTIGPVPKK